MVENVVEARFSAPIRRSDAEARVFAAGQNSGTFDFSSFFFPRCLAQRIFWQIK